MLVAGAGRRAGAARLLRRGARRARGDGARGRAAWRSTCPSATPCRCSTSAPPRAASTATPAGRVRGGARAGARCRSPSWPRRPRGSRARACALNAGQAYVAEILARSADLDARVRRAVGARRAACCARASCCATPSSATRSSGSAREGAEPFYRGDIAARGRATGWRARGGSLDARRTSPPTSAIEREPVRVAYRDREVLTNPPPSAGGTLLAYALGAARPRPGAADARAASSRRWRPRRPSARRSSSRGSARPGFLERFLRVAARARPRTSRCSTRDGLRVQRDVHQRRGLGRGRARHRHPPQQHDGRGGPQPARLPPPPAGPADAEHDGARRS